MTDGDGTTDEPVQAETRRRTVQRIRGEERTGLIELSETRFANSPAGWRAWADALNRTGSRESLFELIEALEERANGVARASEYESLYDEATIVEQRDGDEIELTGPIGSLAKAGTPMAFAWSISKHAGSLRSNIADFEKRCDDEGLLKAFYWALGRAIHLTLKVELLTIAENEKAILRGSEKSFNHHGAPETEQRAGAALVRKLAGPKPSRKANAAAIREVAERMGKDRSTVYEWLRNHPE